MKKIEIYLLEVLLFICIIVFNFLYRSHILMNLSILLIGFCFFIRFGWMKDNNYSKKTVTKIVISCMLAYFATVYLLGLLLGFYKTVFSLNIHYILEIVILNGIIIAVEEGIRYIICRNTPHKKLPLVLYATLLSILNIIIEINGYNLNDNEVVFIFITTVVIPIICREAICSYLVYKVSALPSIVYKESIVLYQYVLPIIPKLGNYLYAVAGVALPYLIYMSTRRIIQYNEKDKKYHKKIVRRIGYIPILASLLIIVVLVSGFFSHTIVAIGSNSMAPSYYRGDAVIFEKEKPENIKIGQVLAFQHSGIIITHRVINIQKQEKQYIFYTKGDANNKADSYKIKEEEVLGVVKYSVKYIGYPTLWFNDIYTRKEKRP